MQPKPPRGARSHEATHPNTARQAAAGTSTRKLAAEKLGPLLLGTQSRFTPFSPKDLADPRERAFANKLVTTVLRRRGQLDHIAAQLLERGLPKRAGLFAPLLYLGLAELLFMPEKQAHATLFTMVEILKSDRRGARHAKLLNAVLRTAQRQAQQFQAAPGHELFPQWLRERWNETYGPEAVAAFGEALLATPPLDLSLKSGIAPQTIGLLGEQLLGGGLRIAERDRTVEQLPGYAEGAWWVQDFAAALPARLLGVEPGANVLDMCAAPGGKTAQLLDMGYRATALDADPERLSRLETNLARLGYTCPTVLAKAEEFKAAEELGQEGQFDAVLLDAPCTATGTFRRHPEVLFARGPKDIADRVRLQRALLANAARLLRPGGVLVYATCSLEPEEGEDQAEWVRANLPQLEPAPFRQDELEKPEKSAATAQSSPFTAPITPQGYVRTHPAMAAPDGIAGGMDGFFIARFVKQL